MTEQESGAEARQQEPTSQPTPQNGTGPQAPQVTPGRPKVKPSGTEGVRAGTEASDKPTPTPTPASVASTPTPAAAPRPVRRTALVRCKGVLCVPGKKEIVTFNMGREFHPERIVLHHLCVRGLLIEDIRVRKEGSTDLGVSKLDGEGELIGEAFIASIAENHTPDLGMIEKNGAVDLHVKNVAPNPVMVHGHILGFVYAVP